MIGMNVLQHCLSGQRSPVPNASVKVLDALGVRACATDESRIPIVFSDAVHNKKSTECLPLTDVIGVTFCWTVITL